MTEPIDDRRAGAEWAPPSVEEPRPVEVRPADGALPGSPVTLGGSPAGGSAAAFAGESPVSAAPLSPVPPGAPTRITLPPELRPTWAAPSGGLPRPDGVAPPAYPGWAQPGGLPPATPHGPTGHPLADPNWSAARSGNLGGAGPATTGWPSGGGALPRTPSGLFPSGPPRPSYREPHPVRGSAVAIGTGAGALWMLLFGLVASTARGYAWWTVSAGITGWLAALVLARYGDRGVAVGVAASTGLGAAIAGSVVFAHFIGGHWLLW
jgi:hypothetical protein